MYCWNATYQVPSNVPPYSGTSGRRAPSNEGCCKVQGRPMRGCGLSRPSGPDCRGSLPPDYKAVLDWRINTCSHPCPTHGYLLAGHPLPRCFLRAGQRAGNKNEWSPVAGIPGRSSKH